MGESGFGVIATIFVGLTIVDTIIETLLLRTGLYAYPGGIRGITLFAGHTYQLPLSETVLFGGLGLGAIAVLSYFRDDRGRSLPERGIDQLRIGGERVKTVARFVAIVGICQLSILLTYNIPYQLYALHSQMSPVYLEQPWRLGGVCGPGTNYDCPGPGVPIPRQDSETNRVASNPK